MISGAGHRSARFGRAFDLVQFIEYKPLTLKHEILISLQLSIYNLLVLRESLHLVSKGFYATLESFIDSVLIICHGKLSLLCPEIRAIMLVIKLVSLDQEVICFPLWLPKLLADQESRLYHVSSMLLNLISLV